MVGGYICSVFFEGVLELLEELGSQESTFVLFDNGKTDAIYDFKAFYEESVPYADNHIKGKGDGKQSHEPLSGVSGRLEANVDQPASNTGVPRFE